MVPQGRLPGICGQFCSSRHYCTGTIHRNQWSADVKQTIFKLAKISRRQRTVSTISCKTRSMFDRSLPRRGSEWCAKRVRFPVGSVAGAGRGVSVRIDAGPCLRRQPTIRYNGQMCRSSGRGGGVLTWRRCIGRPAGKRTSLNGSDEYGQRHPEIRLLADRSVANRIKAQIEEHEDRCRRGLVDPRGGTYRDHEARPLPGHVEDFRQCLAARGDAGKHAQVTAYRSRRVIESGRSAGSPTCRSRGPWMPCNRSGPGGFNQQTINHYVRAVKAFTDGCGRTSGPGSITWPTWPRRTPRPTAAISAAP